ncbi:MAG: hypothetical protein H6981_10040 [Gammaproteobacteria bacterium]|nr:hypothetical protein [Gammaproteobacteria bacterium]MCP5137127.1 hypothetical protein [Gammaproteobacteria bacterium]
MMRRVLLVSLLLISIAAFAIDGIGLSARKVEAFGVTVGSLEIQVSGLEGPGQGVVLRLSGLVLPEPVKGIGALVVDCAKARIEPDAIHCTGGQARLDWDVLDGPEFTLDFEARLDGTRLKLAAHGLRIAGGRADLEIDAQGETRRAQIRAKDTDLAVMTALAARFGVGASAWTVSGGRADLTLDARLQGQSPQRADWTVALRDLAAGNAVGTIACDGAALRSNGRVVWRADRPDIDARLHLDKGQFYVDPVFIELKDKPVDVVVTASRTPDGWSIGKLAVDDPGRVSLTASGTLTPSFAPQAVTVDIAELKLGQTYTRYAQPLLVGGSLADLDLAGNLTGQVRLDDKGLSRLRLALPRADFDDRKGRIGIYGMQADIDWQRDRVRESRLAWNSAHFQALDLGAIDWRVQGDGRALTLRPPARLPILDGALQIDTLKVSGLDGDPEGRFEGFLEPIDMQALSHAFAWPSMEGKLSGMIPIVSYQDKRVKVGGVLLMRLFDGNITLRDLEMIDPLGIAPVVTGNLEMKSLDLDTLTRTFAFGNIQGRLDGWVRGLRMVNWQPIEFDAGFITPEDDDSRHRISQKAVDNLTSLGGVSGALSRTFMRFFESFSYDRLGLTCRLRNSVCDMGGVLPAGDGSSYYIVKGGGLPRIDVVGFAQRVDWPTLLERLQRVTSGGGPQIQ